MWHQACHSHVWHRKWKGKRIEWLIVMLPDCFESQTASLSYDPMNRALLISRLFTTQSISNHMILIKLIVPIRSISKIGCCVRACWTFVSLSVCVLAILLTLKIFFFFFTISSSFHLSPSTFLPSHLAASLSSSLQLGARNMSKLSEQGQLGQFTFDYREPQSEGDMWEEENKFKCES